MSKLDLIEIDEGISFAYTRLSSWVILHDDSQVALIDCGYAGQRNLIAVALESAGLAGRRIDAVLLTHAHADHAGNAAYLEARGARIIASPIVAAAIRRTRLEQVQLRHIWRHLWRPRYLSWMLRAIGAGGLRWEPVTNVELATPEVLAQLPGVPQAYETHGHAEGHTCFLLNEGRLVATGDALVSSHPVSGDLPRPGALAEVFNKTHVQALIDAAGLPIENAMVLPGHGRPVKPHE